MKFKANKVGDRRIVKRYCFIPRKINDIYYWLHPINILQEYSVMFPTNGWYDIEVVETKKDSV